MARKKISQETRDKFINLIKTFGDNDELEVFDICCVNGIELEDSTIDKISFKGPTIVFYYNENTDDFDTIDVFEEENLNKFADELTKYIEDFSNKDYVRDCIIEALESIFEMDEAERVADVLLDEVYEDVIETADKCFNNSDVDIALARVLKKHIGIED